MRSLSGPDIKYEFLAYGLIFVAALFWTVTLTIKYSSLGYFDWDLAFFNQSMWNLLRGEQFSSLFNRNFLGNHANFIAFIFLPLYAIFPSALCLIYLKVFFLTLAALPIFLIARRELNSRYGIFFILLYFLYPALNYAIAYEFDWENLATFSLLWLFYFYYKKNFQAFCLVSLLTLSIKENLPLALFMFGIHAIFGRRERKWWLFSLLISIIWFYLSVFLIVPHFYSSKQHGYWFYYPILKEAPIQVLKFLFSSLNLDFILKLFLPLAFISLLRPDILFLGSLLFLQHMLSSQWTQHTIYFHYTSSLIPFIFLGAIFSLKFLLLKIGVAKKRFLYFIITAMIICSLGANTEFLPVLGSIFSNARDDSAAIRRESLKIVPKDASVIATFAFLPELSKRGKLYAFFDAVCQVHYNDSRPLPDMEYALIDFNDPYLKNELKSRPLGYQRMRSFFKKKDFQIIAANGNIALFKKKDAKD